jgi:hypothetical protein
MRWILPALVGAVLAAFGAVGLAHELAHGDDIWRRHNLGIAPLAGGGVFVWSALSVRANGGGNRPIWPSVILFAVLTAVTVALYLIAPPVAVLFLIVVAPFGLPSRAESWIGRG